MMFSNNSGGGGSGKAGVGISTAVVNTSGHLIVTLTNGTVVDAGYVEGANWRTSDGIPANTLGNDGDLCLDTSGTGNVYAKSAGEWALKTNLKGASGSGTGDMLAATYATGTKTNTSKVDHCLLADEATKLSTARSIELTGDVTGSVEFNGSSDASIAATLANSGVTAATYSGRMSVTVNAKGLVTSMRPLTIAEQNIPCGFSLEVVPSFGLASGKVVLPFAMTITQVDICSTTAVGADLAPSVSTNIVVYRNGASVLTQAFSAASTTNSTVNLSFSAGDKIYISQSAINSTVQVTMSFKGVRA